MTARALNPSAHDTLYKREEIPASLDKLVPKKHAARIADAIVIKRDPLSAAFHSMRKDDFDQMVESIHERGYRHPEILIRVDDDAVWVIEGWHRTVAGPIAGKANTLQFRLAGDDAAQVVIDENLYRRQLTPSQRAQYVLDAVKTRKGYTMKDAAKRLGVSYKTVKNLRGALAKMNDNDRKEAERQVAAGEKTVPQVQREQGTLAQSQTPEGRAAAAIKRAPAQPPRQPRGPKHDERMPDNAKPPTAREESADVEDRAATALENITKALQTLAELEHGVMLERAGIALVDVLSREQFRSRRNAVALHLAGKVQAEQDADKGSATPTNGADAAKDKQSAQDRGEPPKHNPRTKAGKLVRGLWALGYQERQSRSGKYRTFVPTPAAAPAPWGALGVYVGKSGALRVGKNASTSRAVDPKHVENVILAGQGASA